MGGATPHIRGHTDRPTDMQKTVRHFPRLSERVLNSKCASRLIDPTKICQKFKCKGISQQIQNCVHGEVAIRVNSKNVFYHSVQKLSSSRNLHKNVRIKTYRTIILPVVLCGCETWSLSLRDEQTEGVRE